MGETTPPVNYQDATEQQTRGRLIDRDLARAGWTAARRTLIEEFALAAHSDIPGDSPEFADYALLGSDGKPIAVVEAKRTSRDELAGKRQASDYADRIKARFGIDPFIFLTNGKEIQFWDRDRYPPRKIAGFYTRDDLERLKHQKKYGMPAHEVPINPSIAGRDYQNEAIRRVTEGIDSAKRRFLLVMATGTGKTRTAIALVDTLFRAKRVQRVLFLADRRELVRQAMSEFKTHLSAANKAALLEWGQTVATLSAQFQPNSPAWPMRVPNMAPVAWKSFKELMEAFYKKALNTGLPYSADGSVVTQGGVRYSDFVNTFRIAHQHPDASPDIEDVCVLCGGPLGKTPEVDHWIAIHAFPLLSVCANNLLPICGECNSTSNKGQKRVYGPNGFADWFHPYLRPCAGTIQMGYRVPELEITLSVANPSDALRVQNLDRLLNLSKRWTRKFKAGYASQQDCLKRLEKKRLHNGQPRHTHDEVKIFLENFRDGLPEYESFYEVQQVLAQVLLEPERLAAWHTELGEVT